MGFPFPIGTTVPLGSVWFPWRGFRIRDRAKVRVSARDRGGE